MTELLLTGLRLGLAIAAAALLPTHSIPQAEEPAAPARAMLAVEDGRALLSQDAGATWEALALPWPSHAVEGDFSPDPNNWCYDPVKLVGLSRDQTAAVFAFDTAQTGLDGLLLCVGGRLAYFPELTYYSNPRQIPASVAWGDFDGDGTDELAVSPCMATGTGVSLHDLYVFERDGHNIALGGVLQGEDVMKLALGLPEGLYAGSTVSFGWAGDELSLAVGVCGDDGGFLNYVGELEGPVDYGGGGLTIEPAKLDYHVNGDSH